MLCSLAVNTACQLQIYLLHNSLWVYVVLLACAGGNMPLCFAIFRRKALAQFRRGILMVLQVSLVMLLLVGCHVKCTVCCASNMAKLQRQETATLQRAGCADIIVRCAWRHFAVQLALQTSDCVSEWQRRRCAVQDPPGFWFAKWARVIRWQHFGCLPTTTVSRISASPSGPEAVLHCSLWQRRPFPRLVAQGLWLGLDLLLLCRRSGHTSSAASRSGWLW